MSADPAMNPNVAAPRLLDDALSSVSTSATRTEGFQKDACRGAVTPMRIAAPAMMSGPTPTAPSPDTLASTIHAVVAGAGRDAARGASADAESVATPNERVGESVRGEIGEGETAGSGCPLVSIPDGGVGDTVADDEAGTGMGAERSPPA
jgi:hypothetical protein